MKQAQAKSAPAVDATANHNEPQPRWPELTAREAEVADMLAVAMPSREIADKLGIDVKTIDTHRGHALKKLSLSGNVALAREAVRRGASLEITDHEKREWPR